MHKNVHETFSDASEEDPNTLMHIEPSFGAKINDPKVLGKFNT